MEKSDIKEIKMKLIKWLWCLLPIAMLWIIFYIGSLFDTDNLHWWTFPMFMSGSLIFGASVALAVHKICEFYEKQ